VKTTLFIDITLQDQNAFTANITAVSRNQRKTLNERVQRPQSANFSQHLSDPMARQSFSALDAMQSNSEASALSRL
jgi:hypothetical protein